jgi:hypothetical protein
MDVCAGPAWWDIGSSACGDFRVHVPFRPQGAVLQTQRHKVTNSKEVVTIVFCGVGDPGGPNPAMSGLRRALLSIDVSHGSMEAVSRARIGIVGEFQPNFAPHTAIDTAVEHALAAEPASTMSCCQGKTIRPPGRMHGMKAA